MPNSSDIVGEREKAAALVAICQAIGGTIAAFLILWTVDWQIHNYFATPMYDDIFDRILFYRAGNDWKEIFHRLIAQHNEHRIFTSRIFFYIDDVFFNSREYFQVVATNLMQVIAACIAFRAMVYGADWRHLNIYDRIILFLSILILFINANFLYTLINPFQIQQAIMALLCILAAAVISKFSGNHEMEGLAPYRCIALLVLLAVIAAFTLGNAPAILIAAASTAILLRWNRNVTIVLCLLAVIHLVLTLETMNSIGGKSTDVIQIIKFSLLYWGGPFARFNAWPGGYVTWGDSVQLTEVLGLIVLLTSFGFAVVRFFRPGWGGQVAVFGFVLLTIVILTGLAAGSSRVQFGILEATNKKYASFAALGWLGVFAVVFGIVGSVPNVRRWQNALVSLVALAVFVSFTLAGADREMRLWQRYRENNWQAALAAFLEVNDRDPLGDLSPNGASVAEYIKDIYPRGVGIFSYFSFRWGDDAKAFLAEKRETVCRGEVETLTIIPAVNLTNVFDAPGMAGKISGWTWMDKDHAPAETVIAVDARDRIVGVARTIRMSSHAELWLGQVFKRNLGWIGYVRLTEPLPVRFYALSSNNKNYCVLGGVGNAR